MAAYKVINLDSPIESDYWVDIQVRDPVTNKDAVDEKVRNLISKSIHVSISLKSFLYLDVFHKLWHLLNL